MGDLAEYLSDNRF